MTTNRIEDHHLKDGRGRTKDEHSNMQIMGSMLYTAFVRKIRALLLSLMIAQAPLIKVQVTVALVTSLVLLALYIVITMHRMICARHEFAHIARRIDGTLYRAAVALVYALSVPTISGLITFTAIVPNIPDTSSDVPAWIMYVTLLLIAVANFIASIMDDLFNGGITDLLHDEDKDDSALTEDNVDSPAEDISNRPVERTTATTTTALSGFVVGYIFGRSHR